MPERATSARLPASTCPCCASFASASLPSTTTSNASPSLTRRAASTPPTDSTRTAWPVSDSYSLARRDRICRVAIEEISASGAVVSPLIDTPRPDSVDVAQACLRQRLAHLVHVEAEHTGSEFRALVGFVSFAWGGFFPHG